MDTTGNRDGLISGVEMYVYYVCVRSEDSVLIREVSFKSGSTEYFSVSQCDHLISGALDARESSYYADPVVQLSNEVTAGHLHRRLQVHDLVRDVQLMADGLQCVCVCVCVCGRERERERVCVCICVKDFVIKVQ